MIKGIKDILISGPSESNYGSLSINEESVLTLSVSGRNSNCDEIISSSGCSLNSFVGMHCTSNRDKKKQKVKDCLQQIKSLLIDEFGKKSIDGSSTLATLHQVIDRVRKAKDNQSGRVETPSKITPSKMIPFAVCEKEFRDIVMTSGAKEPLYGIAVFNGTILASTNELVKLLHYPLDLLQKDFESIVHQQDVPLIASCLFSSINGYAIPEIQITPEFSDETQNKVVHLRLRRYQELSEGFVLKKSKYLLFTVIINDQKKTVKDSNGTEMSYDYKCLLLNLIQPAYKVPHELPENNKFLTKHSIYCQYSFVHPRVIPLLGYLPQEMNGTSIFNYYHPNDVNHLYTMFQKVMMFRGSVPVRSEPYQMRTKNNEYILVQSVWSRCVNPWTKQVEFVVGQHTVLRGPQNTNVFAEVEYKPLPEWEQPAISGTVKKIQQLMLSAVFLETSNQKVAQTQSNLMKRQAPSITSTEVHVEDGQVFDVVEAELTASAQKIIFETETAQKMTVNEVLDDVRTDLLGSSSESKVYSPDLLPTYDLLNYSENIKRFLTGCPQTVISEENESTKSDTLKESNVNILVNLPIRSSPLSFGSSTKVSIGSPPRDMDLDELCPGEVNCDRYKYTMLTQEVLTKHTQLQEAQYLKQIVQQPMSLFCGSPLKQQPSLGKRHHTFKDDEGSKPKMSKMMRRDDCFPIPDAYDLPPRGTPVNQANMCDNACNYLMPNEATNVPSGSMRFIPSSMAIEIDRMLESGPRNTINMPITSNRSFYQPVPCRLLSPGQNTNRLQGVAQTRQVPEIASSSFSSDLSSSMSYYMDRNKLVAVRSRRQRYLVPCGDTTSSSSYDGNRKQRVTQRPFVRCKSKTTISAATGLNSKDTIKDMLTIDNSAHTRRSSGFGSESSDYLKFANGSVDNNLYGDCNSAYERKNERKTECLAPEASISSKGCATSESFGDSAREESPKNSGAEDSPGNLGSNKKEKKKKMEKDDLTSNKLEVESNCSQNSSGITPSESRSTEENRSSLKESEDCSSSKGSDYTDLKASKGRCSPDNESDLSKTNDDILFIPVKSRVSKSPKCMKPASKSLTWRPFWLEQVDMTDELEMKYNVEQREDVLQNNLAQVQSLKQPDMVYLQLHDFLQEIEHGEKSSSSMSDGDFIVDRSYDRLIEKMFIQVPISTESST